MTPALLFDVRPDPVGLPFGLFEVIILAAVALFFTTILIVGIVLFLKFRKRQQASVTNQTAGLGAPQSSHPNQL
jgi:hypothetical protein